jgi:putative ABC transport system permease protein
VFNLPITYSLRNVRRRPWHSLMTVAGVAVVVFAAVLMLSLMRGLSHRVGISGEKANILVISRNGQNLMFSSVTEDEIVSLDTLPGIAVDQYGMALVSPETMHMSMIHLSADAEARVPVYIRGVGPAAYDVHKTLSIVEGRLPEEEDEVLVGNTTHIKMGVEADRLKPGESLFFEGEEWVISGRFEAGGSLVESELWMDGEALKRILRRTSESFAVVRMSNAQAVDAGLKEFERTGALERYFKAWSERGYYDEFGSVLAWVLWLAVVMVITITVAGALIGANTMYAAVMSRMKEIATYRVLGFARSDVVTAFLVESIVLAGAGGVLGVIAGSAVNGLPFKMSYGAFYLTVDAVVVSVGLGLSLFIGVVGCLMPIWKGMKLSVVEGLNRD